MHKILRYLGIMTVSAFTLFGLAMPAWAGPVAIRVETPASPVGGTFMLSYSAMDIEGRPVAVQCLKKGPADAAYSAFGSTANLPAGGGSGACDVNTVVLTSNGSYSIKVTASAGGDTAEAVTSFDFTTEKPDPVRDYSKEKPTDSSYKLKFKTADDGITTAVEIYRSTEQSFDLNSSTRIASIAVGPNTEKEFTDYPPDSAKTYFYVIRAFSATGAGSDPVGDREERTTYVTIMPTGTTTAQTAAIPVAQGSILGADTADADDTKATDAAGTVLGEDTDETTQAGEGEDGAEATATDTNRLYLIGGLIIILIAGGIIYARTRKTPETPTNI